MTAEEEVRIRLKGAKERRLWAHREAKEHQQQAQRRESSYRQASRERLTEEVQEGRQREAEEQRRRRLWDIEERQRHAELRAWEREQRTEVSIKLSPRLSPRSPRDRSRAEENQIEERRLKEKAAKELVHLQSKEAVRRARELREKRQLEIRAEWERRQQQIDAKRQELRGAEAGKRKKVREQLEDKAESRALHRKSITEEQTAQEIQEYTQRELRRFQKEQVSEHVKLQEMRLKGERERLMKEAKDLKVKERALVHRQQMLARATVEQQAQALNEAKERKEKERSLRRFLDIEQRQGRAEHELRDREQQRRSVDERMPSALHFVPPAPKARLIARYGSTRSLSPGFYGVTGS